MLVHLQQQPPLDPAGSIVNAISPDRFASYLTAAGHDEPRALRLYIWNAQIGEAFHLPIQAVEVALRNCINDAIVAEYGSDWWRNKTLASVFDEERTVDLSQVLRRITNRELILCNGQVVAGLSFGFWVGMLQKRYNPTIWTKQLRRAFPDLPSGRSRKALATGATKVATLRNRIWHHEPLIKRDLGEDFHNVMEMLAWLSCAKEAWIRPHCRVSALLRQKP
jgi:hypothetical protein